MRKTIGHVRFFITGQSSRETPPPPFLRFRSSRTFILSTCCIAVFTDIFLYGIIIPVLPFSLSQRAGVAERDVQSWTSTLLAIYGGALLVGSPFVGWYADRTSSRRLPLLIGLFALLAATLLLCLADSVTMLILGRLLQGLSAAIVWVTGCALLVDTVGERDIGQMMGYVSISMSLGILVAPLVGGAVYARAGYYSVFYMAFGTIVLDIILRLALIEKKIAAQWDSTVTPSDNTDEKQERDEKQTAEAELSQTQNEPSVSPDQNTPDTVALEAFRTVPENVPTQHNVEPQPQPDQQVLQHTTSRQSSSSTRHAPPLVTLLKSRRLLAGLYGCIITGALMTSFDSVLPIFVEDTFGWNSTAAGVIFLALYIPSFIAPGVGWVSDKFGPRWPVFIGFLSSIPELVLLRTVDHNSIGQKVLLCALLALIGISFTLTMGPLVAEITYVVEAKERKTPGIFGKKGAYAQAYSLFVMSWAAGSMVGPLLAGFVRDHAGWGTMGWALAITSASCIVPCLLWTGGSIFDVNERRILANTSEVAEQDPSPDV